MVFNPFDLQPELRHVEQLIRQTFDSTVGLAHRVVEHIHRSGGKNLRPRLVILANRAEALFSREPRAEDEALLRMAACVEILHTASLLHDDVIDGAATRRGQPSVNVEFGEDVAILVADMLFSQAFEMALSAAGPEPLRLLCRTSRTMCESELFQIEKRDHLLSEADYLRIIESKTATLFSACAELGALLRDAPPARRQALSEFGLLLGMAFQIADDALDYTAVSDQWGKPVGNDLAQGKQTLPLVHAFARAEDADRAALLQNLRNGRRMDEVLPVIRKYGGLEYAADKARDYVRRAELQIPLFAAGESAAQFEALCRFAIERGY